MGKSVIKVHKKDLNLHEAALESAKNVLGDKIACCILITCSEPEKDGNMQVEMNYEGDESLAAFLLENANQVFEDRLSQRESK